MHNFVKALLLSALLLSQLPFKAAAQRGSTVRAVYLGVNQYGSVSIDQAADFTYRFSVDGEEVCYCLRNETDEHGAPTWPLQNALKVGYEYLLSVENGVVTQVQEVEQEDPGFTPPVSGTPGVRTLKNLLSTALAPVGTTLYVYGGGWNWQDSDGAASTRTIGISPDWVRFFRAQTDAYTYRDPDGDEASKDAASSYYPYGHFNQYGYAGLDCSGYVGWTLYNTFEEESGKGGWVNKSTTFAQTLAQKGLGTWTNEVPTPDGKPETALLPGDILSLQGHVWMALGTCSDGSVVMLHSSPTRSYANQPGGGVQLGAIGKDYNCEALVLAEQYNTKYYPDWHERYPVFLLPYERYIPTTQSPDTGRFTWDLSAENGLSDPDGVRQMQPARLLALLFGAE